MEGALAQGNDVLTALAELERFYDGPIPESLRNGAQYDNFSRHLLIEARAQTDLFAALIRDQIEAIRRARRDGPIPSMLLSDLALYRRQEMLWRREAQRLDAILVTPSADDAP